MVEEFAQSMRKNDLLNFISAEDINGMSLPHNLQCHCLAHCFQGVCMPSVISSRQALVWPVVLHGLHTNIV